MSSRATPGSRRAPMLSYWKSLVFLVAATACGGATASSDETEAGGTAGRGGTSGTTRGGATAPSSSEGGQALGGASTAVTCTPAGTVFRSQFTAVNCDVVARVNAEATQILGYRVVCGNAQTVTIESLKAELLPSARVSWFDAASYGSSSDAAYLFVHASSPYDVIAFGVTTGLPLFEFSDSNTPPMFGAWSQASDIDGNCNGPTPAFNSLGPWDASDPGQGVLDLVYKKGLIDGVNAAFGGYRAISVVRANLPTLEYLVIVSSFVHV